MAPANARRTAVAKEREGQRQRHGRRAMPCAVEDFQPLVDAACPYAKRTPGLHG